MFSKKIAGVGVAAAVVGSALIPSTAFADDPDEVDTTVTIQKTIVAPEQVNPAGDTYSFTIEKDPCVEADQGCRLEDEYPAWVPTNPSVTYAATDANNANGKVKTTSFQLPDASNYSKAGIYVWKVSEVQSGAADSHTVTYSAAEYKVKAYIKLNGTAKEYAGVSIVKTKNDYGFDITSGEKHDKLEFVNTYEDTQDVVISKTVVNNSGLKEDTMYFFTVVFTFPNGMPENGPLTNSQVGSMSMSVDPASNCTTVTFEMEGGRSAHFTNVPVGTTVRVTEGENSAGKTEYQVTSTSSKVNSGAPVTSSKVESFTTDPTPVTDGGVTIAFTNTYDNITPTGIALAVLPYVLMIGIPLLAIAGYIALRRKMNL